jgi:hypothetical protein
MCTVPLPAGVNPIAVKKYIIIYIPIVEDELTTLPRNVGIWLANEAASFSGRNKFVILIVACIRVNIAAPVSWRQTIFLLHRKLCRVRTHKRISYGVFESMLWHLQTKEFACEEFMPCCSSHPYRAQVLSIPRKLSKTEDKLCVGEKAGCFYKGTYPAERYCCTLMRPEATII